MITKPNSKKKKIKRHKKRTRYLLKRILITNALSILIIIGTYFWMIYFLSNVGSFWDLFRKKEIYVQKDTVPPTTPYLHSVPEATQSDTINIQGNAEPGIKVILYIDNSRQDETISDSQGAFSFTDIKVNTLSKEIYVMAQDEAGNTSHKSTSYTTVLDKTPPEIEIFAPQNGEVHKSTGHNYTVKGKSDPGTTVLVNGQFALIDPNGEFSATLRLEKGENIIEIIAKDKAENETEKTISMKFEKIE